MLDQALYPAQAFGQGEDLASLQHPLGPRHAARDHGRNHAAKSVHLPLGKVVLRMRGQARIVNQLHVRTRRQPFGNRLSVSTVAFHAQGERFQSAQCEKTVKRSGYRSDCVL